MNWTKTLEFIDAADPSFAAKMTGIPAKDIEAMEAGLGIRLPESYRRFLLTMGVESDDFHPFTETQTHSFYQLMELLPGEDYPTKRFFRVSFASDDSQISARDNFLDLARSDGVDAPLVTFEGGGGFKQEYVADTGRMCGEQITDTIFRFFELDRRPLSETIFKSSDGLDEAERQMKVALDLLSRMKFELALPPLRHIACLRRGEASAIVMLPGPTDLLEVDLASTDRKELRVLVDQILVAIPGTERYDTNV